MSRQEYFRLVAAGIEEVLVYIVASRLEMEEEDANPDIQDNWGLLDGDTIMELTE